jgi:alpha-galactosidase
LFDDLPEPPVMTGTPASAANAAQSDGHEVHTRPADRQRGLDGSIDRPINLTFLGAGSGFCPRLAADVMLIPGADHGEIRLVDIDRPRLELTEKIIADLIGELGKDGGWSVRATTERREVLPGTMYAICCVEVSGPECVALENDIPLRYGVDQCIGDTVGAGGLFKALRTVPVYLEILRDIAELCPEALMLNYTNPMGIMCLAAGRAVPEVRTVGLCHSVQGTSHLLADYAQVPYEQLEWQCAGINHLAWFTTLRHQGRDLYEKVLYEKFEREVSAGIAEAEAGRARHDSKDPRHDDCQKHYEHADLVRKDMCLHFGAFVTESSGHLSEYVPYYRKSDAGRRMLRLGYDGGSRFYASNWPDWRRRRDERGLRRIRGEEPIEPKRSWEYASWIIEACEKDAPYRLHGNVMNTTAGGGGADKLIANLPGDGCVEVKCIADRNGISPTRHGVLPAQMAAICRMNMNMIDLAAAACIEKSKQAAIHALTVDPLTAAVCTPAQIKAMALELFEAEARFLPGFD